MNDHQPKTGLSALRFPLSVVAIGLVAGPARGVDDCNANGIPDAIELAPTPDFVSQEHAAGCTPFSVGSDSVTVTGTRVPFDVDGDGDTDLFTADHGAGTVTILLNAGSGAFTFSATVPTGGAPWAAEAGDLDGDGDADLVVPDIDGVVRILLNEGGGAFAVDAALPTGNGATAGAIADLDGDGDLDIAATVQGNQGGIRLFFNAGDATFAPALIVDSAGSNTIVAGDLDGDGDDDLLVGESATSIRVLLNDGAGAFPFQAVSPCGGQPSMVELGDMDGDGDLDALVAHGFVTGSFSVLMNDGGGAFAPPVTYAVADDALHALPVDIDADGDLDVVVVEGDLGADRSLIVLRNPGDGALVEPIDVPGGSSFHCAAGDLDGDGIADLAAARNGACLVAVHLQRPLEPAASDCNGNGVPDACDAGAIVLFEEAETYGTGDQPVSLIASATRPSDGAEVPLDLDGDGHTDVAAVNENGSTLSILMNEGAQSGAWLGFADSIEHDYAVGAVGPVDLAAGDIDGDGDQDVVTVAIGTGFLTVFRNLGDGALDAAANTQQGEGLAGVVLADLDGDGDLDVAVSDEANDRVAVIANPGDGAWDDSPDLYPVGGLPRGIAKGDLDGDGDIDLAVTNQLDGTVTVLFNDGDGAFPETADIAVGGEPYHLTAADIDGDGALDLAVVDTNNFGGLPGLILLRNDGAGGFELQATYMTGDQPRSVHAADLDGDGRLDLVVANRASDSVTVFMNAGSGQLGPVATHDVGQVPGRAIAADVDGSGDLDLLSADQFDDTVSVLLHDGVVPGADVDGNGVPDDCEEPEPVPGDATGDGVVDVSDLILVITSWGACDGDCPADLDGNGLVDVTDLVLVVLNWD